MSAQHFLLWRLLCLALLIALVHSYSVTTRGLAETAGVGISWNVLSLTRKTSATGYNKRGAAHLLARSRASKLDASNHATVLESLFVGEGFATTITFGTETFESIVDTGSSDTWIVESGFSCVDIETKAPETELYCMFGPTYNVSDTFSQIPDENFNITYGDGEFLTGIVGYEKVTLAGLTVNQTVSLVNYAAWEGDNTTSGLTVLAYPLLTSAYAGTGPAADNTAAGEQIQYSPTFETLYRDNPTSSLFSLAILRNVSGPSGFLSFGGLPPVNISGDFTSTPILITSIEGYPKTYDFYTIAVGGITVDGFKAPSTRTATKYIVDSGTTLNYFPTFIADAINYAFFPPAMYDEGEGIYIVSSDATAPDVGVTISGTTFHINPLDMILLARTDDEGNNVCISGIDDGGSDAEDDIFILGDTFQKNVVSVFDVGAGMMRFVAREDYPNDDPVKV